MPAPRRVPTAVLTPYALLALALVTTAAGRAEAQPAPAPPRPAPPAAEEPPPIDHPALRKALAAKPAGAEAVQLADKVRRWFGAEALKNGAAVKAEGLEVAWAIEAPGAKEVFACAHDRTYRLRLDPLGGSGVWAAVATLSDGTAFRFCYEVDGRVLGSGQLETYAIHPDSLPQPGVPRGKVIAQKKWKSRIFADTERDWWIYVPAQYRPTKPAAVMVFQDGGNHYVKTVPPVFDNLIHKGDMPVTVGVFLNPGVFADGRRNRMFEYDTLSDQYARFLLEEILPEVEKTAKLRKDPESRAIGGLSSGGICAFTVAWERPDQFRKVLSWIGSFVNIAAGPSNREGGHNYPPLIRRLPKKPIRVFLQDGTQDQEQVSGSWPLANLEMERALTFAGWDMRMVWGRGFHSPKHGLAILPDSLRWLWRDHKAAGAGAGAATATATATVTPTTTATPTHGSAAQ
jgi:enterochelin esterase family protein